jgi:hypothetical protein
MSLGYFVDLKSDLVIEVVEDYQHDEISFEFPNGLKVSFNDTYYELLHRQSDIFLKSLLNNFFFLKE